MDRLRYPRPGGRLLGDGDDARVLAVSGGVHAPEKLDRLAVLVAALVVRHPVAGFARIVEVKHRGDRIDAEAVDVKALQPEQRAVDEEARHLGAAEIVDRRVPVWMEAAAWIGMLVERSSVEPAEPVRIDREMRRHPIED